jgi:hypothetical protein
MLAVTSGLETETLSLAGNGVPLPPGAQGLQGVPGPTGATGPAGPAGRIVCRNTAVAKATCEILFAPGTWTAGATARYTLRRGGTVIARGACRVAGGRLMVPLRRGLRAGRYRVTLTTGRGRHAHSLTRTVTVG